PPFVAGTTHCMQLALIPGSVGRVCGEWACATAVLAAPVVPAGAAAAVAVAWPLVSCWAPFASHGVSRKGTLASGPVHLKIARASTGLPNESAASAATMTRYGG